MTGIYKITNNINGKVYIGQATSIIARWKEHLNRPFNENDEGYESHFYRAIRNYGIHSFSFAVVEQCEKEKLDERETYWISYYKSNDKNLGYNLTSGGSGAKDCGIFLNAESANEIKQLLLTTEIKQWDIAKKFNVNQAMISYINNGDLWRDESLKYPLRERKIKQYFCQDCGKEIYQGSTRCVACAKKARRNYVDEPPADELHSVLLKYNGSFTSVGNKYNTTGKIVRGWCKQYGMSCASQDYMTPKAKNKIEYKFRKVQQLNLNTKEVIRTFNSIAEAERETDISHISNVCHGKRKSAGGFGWKFVND